MREYPSLGAGTIDDLNRVVRFAVLERETDVKNFINQKEVFMSGRKVAKIPTGAADVTDGDRVGDFNYDPDYFYILVNNSGTAQWRRASLASW